MTDLRASFCGHANMPLVGVALMGTCFCLQQLGGFGCTGNFWEVLVCMVNLLLVVEGGSCLSGYVSRRELGLSFMGVCSELIWCLSIGVYFRSRICVGLAEECCVGVVDTCGREVKYD